MKTKCMSCGGSMKKMAKGGSMKTTVGKATPKGQIYGIPQTGPTGPNYQGVNTMQKGGATKKMQDGGKTGAQLKKEGMGMKAAGKAMKAQGKAMKEKGRVMAVEGRKSDFVKFGDKVFGVKPGDTVQPPYPFQKGGATKKYKTGGMVKKTKFAALAPPYNKTTFADKIVGAKKNASKKK
jgi:hypothetical protein